MEIVLYESNERNRGAWFGPYRVRRTPSDDYWYIPTDEYNRVGVLTPTVDNIALRIQAHFDTKEVAPLVLALLDTQVVLHGYVSSRNENGFAPRILTLSLEPPPKPLYVRTQSFVPFDVEHL